MRFFSLFFLTISTIVYGQSPSGYWQQHVDYTMDVVVDTEKAQYTGQQTLRYTNNSPDTLSRVFYHLYFNAFQPGSEMDVRSQNIEDPDRRVGNRIGALSAGEQGYLIPLSLTQNGVSLAPTVEGTVLVVPLSTPILPGATTTFELSFKGQVPVQIRRSGRDNAEGVALSMAQWYPKLAEYDKDGWHADPYIAREFYGVWGDFDVSITIDSDYVIGGTGYLKQKKKAGKGQTLWRFEAPNVHDFTWAADPQYVHDTYPGPNGVTLNFYYKNEPELLENWKKLQPLTADLLAYFNTAIGPYPYDQYSVIQGGDGGMEYGMCTLITGDRPLESLVGVTAHEMAHTWFQFLLASNESLHEWMDEGFTSYISTLAEDVVMQKNSANPLSGAYRGYDFLANSGQEQPLSTHADRYSTNRNYGIAAYSKGAVFLAQLGYVIGDENLAQTLKSYFKTWAFKHPAPEDFIRVAERVSGLELDWYLQDFAKTTNTIDYGIKAVVSSPQGHEITLERVGLMPMPIEVVVSYTDGTSDLFYIPLQMMRGEKGFRADQTVLTLPDWAWAMPTYTWTTTSTKTIQEVVIDPSQRMADHQKQNNAFSPNG